MKEQIEYLRITRENVLNLIEGLSIDQLNKIPEGFKNNIIWNVGHNLITQQLLHYRLGGAQPIVSDELIDKYRKGSFPEHYVKEEEITYIKELFLPSVDQLEKDYSNKVFSDYTEYTTSYGANLKSIEDAVTFNTIHEGLHLGVIMALKKLV